MPDASCAGWSQVLVRYVSVATRKAGAETETLPDDKRSRHLLAGRFAILAHKPRDSDRAVRNTLSARHNKRDLAQCCRQAEYGRAGDGP